MERHFAVVRVPRGEIICAIEIPREPARQREVIYDMYHQLGNWMINRKIDGLSQNLSIEQVMIKGGDNK